MNNKNKKILNLIFQDPILSNIEWKDIESLFVALGGKITEGSGSRVRIKLGDVLAVFHRPHPQKTIDKGALKSVRKFLKNSNLTKLKEGG